MTHGSGARVRGLYLAFTFFIGIAGLLRASVPSGTSLGQYTFLSESAAQGNALALLYGNSTEGGGLTTYWQSNQPLVSVVAVGNNYYELVENIGQRCITVVGSQVTTSTCAGSASQQMTFSQQGDGSYTVEAQTGKCVQALSSFGMVQAATCNGSSAQRWQVTGTTPLVLSTPAPVSTPTPTPSGTNLGTFSLLNQGATQGNSMVLMYGASSEGDGVTTYWASPTNAFTVMAMANQHYELVENIGSRCMTVNGASVNVTTCNGATQQLLSLLPQADGSYAVQSASGACIEAPAGFSTVAAQPCNTAATQKWNFNGPSPLILPGPVVPVTVNPPSATVPTGYHLTFDDEFGSLSLSDQNAAGTKWYTHTVQCCLNDTSNPSSPTHMAGVTAPAGQNPYSLGATGLDIRLQKTNGAWYSGVIATVDGTGNGFAQKYGYFEMRAKFPAGLGTWPAFWLLNQNALTKGAPAGEIDIVESYMQFPTYINTTLHDWTPPATTPGYKQAATANLSNGFHVFGMLWTASTMTFYCDGVTLYTMPTPSIMNQPYYPIIDLGLGGGWPTAQTPRQSDLIVQYMRVYAP